MSLNLKERLGVVRDKFSHISIRLSIAALFIGAIGILSLMTIVGAISSIEQTYATAILSQQEQFAAFSKKIKFSPTVSTQTPRETDRIIVKFNENKLPPGLTIAATHANLEKAQGLKKLFAISGIDAYVYEVSADDSAREVVDRILAQDKGKGQVAYAEVDMLMAPNMIPNDPLFGSQWHHGVVQTPTAWDLGQGESVTFAVLDTGVNPHPDIALSPVQARNFYDGTTNVTDVYGHGTDVAGVGAAVGNNSIGLSGIAPRTLVLPIRIAADDGYGSYSAVAQGLAYAADNGARVANISYSFCGVASIIDASRYMRSKGGVVTISAGNSGGENSYAISNYQTCVPATASDDTRASWSSYGQYVDVAAPGVSIYSTDKSGGYQYNSGTSFSAPLVAGVYALMFSVNPALTPDQADNILFTTADDLGEPGWDQYYGWGRVNAAKAAAAARAAIGTQDITPPTIPQNLRSTAVAHNSVSLAWNASTDDNSGVANYAVYKDGTKLATVSGTTYAATNLSPLTAYTFTVVAIDGAGNTSASSTPLSVTTPDITFAIASYSVPVKTANSATVSVTLTKSGGVTVKYGTSATTLSQSAQSTNSGTSHSVSLSGLAAGVTYYYQVVAIDPNGAIVSSAVSNFKTARTKGGSKR